MERRVTIVYSEPVTSRYDEVGEAEAEKAFLMLSRPCARHLMLVV